MSPVRIALFGLGPIGKAVGALALSRANLEIVGAVDVDPHLVGLDLGRCLEAGRDLGIRVTADADEMLAVAKPEVVLHCTGSSIERVAGQLRAIVGRGAAVVSTCEELSFPWLGDHPEVAELDELARALGVAVLGTGVNPGFAMDTVPLLLSGAAQRVDHVSVSRVQDAAARRLPLQRKVGVGISVEEFEARRDTIGHVGLPESLHLLAGGLGWRLERTERTLEPVIAAAPATYGETAVDAGCVLGVHERVRGFVDGRERIVLDLRMYAGAPDPHDAVEIEGVPDVRSRVDGLHGDLCTAAVAVNCVGAVLRARPGVLTMLDVPLVTARTGDLPHLPGRGAAVRA